MEACGRNAKPLSFVRSITHSGHPALAKKPNYDFEKRKKEEERRKKKEAKREDRLARKREGLGPEDGDVAEPTSEDEPV